MVFGKNITLRHPHKISIGNNVMIDDNCILDAKGEDNKGIFIGNRVTMGRNSALTCKNGDITIGSSVNITPSVQITVAPGGKIEIGDNVEIGSFSDFSAGTYNIEKSNILPSAQGRISRGIVVKDLVMIGAGVIVMDGVTIGRNSIIGAGSVITRSIPEHSVAFGVPAKVVRERRGKETENVD
ncbi:2,3,4,5-tetrahydropyridine-2,6-dicarboxylate N-acetyltransferase [subsurface metagenome]